MWMSLFLATVLAASCLLVPGFFFLRALDARWEYALCLAPAPSVVAFGVLAIVYGALGVPSSLYTLFVPISLLSMALFALRCRRGAGDFVLHFAEPLDSPLVRSGLLAHVTPIRLALLLSVVAAVVTSLAVYVFSLGDPNAFVQTYDNAWHLSRVHEFAETSNYSSLAGGFYPSAWHTIAAMVESSLGVSTAVAEHASNLAFIVAVFPPASVILLAALFPDRPRAVVLGGMLCLIFAFFPWRIMLFGPLYPNLAAFSMMPSEAALFILLCDGISKRKERVRYGALFVVGGMAMALAQPNAIFSTGVFLMPYCVWRVSNAVYERLEGRSRRLSLSILAGVLLVVVLIALWLLLANMPFMSAIVNYSRLPMLSVGQAIRWGLGFAFVIRRQQFFIAAVVALGALLLLLRPRRRWLVFSNALLLGIFVVAISTEGTVQHIIAGFWYSDFYRLAASVCIFSVPVVAVGMDAIVGAVMWCAKRVGERFSLVGVKSLWLGAGASAIVVAAILALNYVPFDFIEWYYRSYAFDAVSYEMRDLYQNPANRAFEEDERAFVEKAVQLLGDDDKVLNIPFDGSAFAYSACGLNVVFDSFGIDQDSNIATLRTGLNRIAYDDEVREAARASGIEYVLQLDHGSGPYGFRENSSLYLLGYDKTLWRGLTSIGDDTPGFECVLSEGDMRLYRITG